MSCPSTGGRGNQTTGRSLVISSVKFDPSGDIIVSLRSSGSRERESNERAFHDPRIIAFVPILLMFQGMLTNFDCMQCGETKT